MSWSDIEAKLDGRQLIRHAVLTYNGTWGAGITQYPGNVVDGLAQYVDDSLCYEVPIPYPATFGPIGGAVTAPSYQQSMDVALELTADWLAANPNHTFALGGYSQGAEAASQVAIELMSGSLQQYLPNFIGGYTFGNPSRMAGAHAPTIRDPGGHGISATLMPALPTVGGRVVWADYVHSPNNGDAGLDMYASVPNGQVGKDMTDVYASVTQIQFNNFGALAQDLVQTLVAVVNDLGVLPAISGGLPGILQLGTTSLLGLFGGLISGSQTNATGPDAALFAAVAGLKFLAAPGGPTAPHISYLGEIGGYSNQVADAVGFLAGIARLTPARA